jgi:ubiquinone/menaquinone biosynthesis C-methylase UbiE
MDIFAILQSPDDGTSIRPGLVSEGGIKYEMTKSGILLLDPKLSHPSDALYSSPMFEKWNAIVSERIEYYTGKRSVAGLIAHWSYFCMRSFNQGCSGEWLLDIGCGNGAHLAHVKDRSSYIGLDKNLQRLEILKKNHPETTAIYGDVNSLPFKTGSLKHVFSSNAFEHFWYLKDAVMELFRCIHPKGRLLVVIPTEGGLWNLGRKFLSKPHFQKRYPNIDFEFISHVEHCNVARQVIRSLETFFHVKKKFKPTRAPLVSLNAIVELDCYPKDMPDLMRK